MSSLEELGGWPAVFAPLCAGTDLSRDLASAAMTEILSGEATPAQIAALAIGLRIKGETVAEMAGLVGAMLAFADRVPLSPATAAVVIDTCGTGGDRSGTINVSTIAAFVAAGAGAKVCKHGNRAASSKAGSADLLEALGVAIDLGPTGVAQCVEEAGMGFCFAARFHAAMRHAIPVRRELGVPTVFNFLGPLANPARVRRQVVGVSDPRMAGKVLGVLEANGADRAFVVYGHDGLDELTTAGPSTVHELRDGEARTFVVEPEALGLAPAGREDLVGGDAAANAVFAREVLGGAPGPKRDIVVLNAAAALVVAGCAPGLEQGVADAQASIDSGRAAGVLDALVAVSTAAPR
ncbi:MAG TPA: anthranilate phosphoribosyltransferase [Acidimicrobiales bacterium]|nr:anthranilate phosphoribosyltransferase [Acidimicrobiales bacterium]